MPRVTDAKLAELDRRIAAGDGHCPDDATADIGDMVADLIEARRAPEWRPINTAPQNGTRILGWFPQAGTAYVVHWGRKPFESPPNWTLDDNESATIAYDRPTHWMLLPTPPGR